MFHAMDKSGLYLTREELEAIMKRIDHFNHGVISYSEFLIAALDKKNFLNEEVTWEIFKKFDIDLDERISKEDFMEALE